MPWHLVRVRDGWYVVDDTGKRKSSKPMSRSRAERYRRALYAVAHKSGWERIAGNLCRSPSGQFSACDKVMGSGQSPKPTKPKKPSPEERLKSTIQQAVSAGGDREQLSNLIQLSSGSLPKESAQGLIQSGLAEVVNGRVMLTPHGRAAVSALKRGAPSEALDAVARGQAQVESRRKKEEEAAEARRKREEEAAEARRKKEEEKTRRGRGGGGGRRGSEKKTSEEVRQENRARVLSQMASNEEGLNSAAAQALLGFAAGEKLDDQHGEGLINAGLVDQTPSGPVLTSEGKKVISALNAGDYRGAMDALTSAQERRRRQEEQRRREEEKREEQRRREEEKREEQTRREEEKREEQTRREELRREREDSVVRRAAASLGMPSKDVEHLLARLRSQTDDDPSFPRQALLDAARVGSSQDVRRILQRFLGRGSSTTVEVSPAVFKDLSGRYRWLTVSSNRYQDREKEIVSEEALRKDVEYADSLGGDSYGPLRWWHLGTFSFKDFRDWRTVVAGPGVDLGRCDFNAIVDGFLVESGTFYDDRIGEWASRVADRLQVSLGFSHPPDEPRDGVYYNIRRFERSLLPRGRASNPYTSVSITTKEGEMVLSSEKIAELQRLGFPQDVIDKLIESLQAQSKELREQGITFKDVDDALTALSEKVSELKEEADTPTGEEGGEGEFIGDLPVEEFFARVEQVVHSAFRSVLSEIQSTLSEMDARLQEMGYARQKEKEVPEDDLSRLLARIKELEEEISSLPRAGRHRPSTRSDNVIQQKGQPDGAEVSPLSWVKTFLESP